MSGYCLSTDPDDANQYCFEDNASPHDGSRSLRHALCMAIHIVRLGSKRSAHEGLRIGTVRRPPRGVAKEDIARRNYYDVWFPNLSPSAELVKEALSSGDEKSWASFRRKFIAEMKEPSASKDLDLLAALSHHTNVAIGCYCEDETRCHRSVLRALLEERGAKIASEAREDLTPPEISV